jgi:hypothetical protein
MSGTYTWPQVVNGKNYQQSDFSPYGYATNLPDLLGNFAAQAASAQGAVQAANAAASAAAAAISAAQAANRVAGVTAGSTANLVYPEAVASLVTATDVRDVCIYDTRLDSDGGAWRWQCQHTSWHQEALNTATRGAKREFPAVALIVAREASLTIYDLHDLDGGGAPRMWMVVPATNLYSGTGLRRAAALNGTILLAGSAGLLVYDFDRDVVGRHLVGLYEITARSIATREVGIAINVASAGLASNDVLDVAMRVLPGALRDGAGLPIPTIAVATTGGASVIHPDGRVASITFATGYDAVSFISDSTLAINRVSGTTVFVGPIPYASVAESSWWARYFDAGSLSPALLPGMSVFLTADAVGNRRAVHRIAYEEGNLANSMVAYTAVNFATGWQPGDIRLAALCDGRTGALANDIRLTLDGTSVIGFASVNSGTVTSTSGRIRIARNGVENPAGSIGLSGLTVGETYTVDFDAWIGTAGNWSVAINSAFVNILRFSGTSDVTQARIQFVAETTTGQLEIYAITNTGTNYAEFDNITVRAGVADRSYRARGLHAIGSLSRTPVGTGNDVVAFSGFSVSNYLEQPYSSLLDFGAGDFSIALWVRGGINTEYLLDRRAAGTGAGAGFYIQMASGNTFSFACTDGSSYPTAVSTSQAAPSVWRFVVASRRSGVAEIWIDGVREATIAASMSVSASNPLRVGISSLLSNPSLNASLALLRIAAYAPTSAQIARMYRDEAPLFDTGAKAFLGGTSSAVNDLSFSEQSRRLAVATADGVSIFSGLRRVEYLSTGNLLLAMGANNTSKVALEAGALMVGTTANAGVRRDAITGLDRMQAAPRAPFAPRRITARGVTTDATPLALAPRLHIGERETLIVQAAIVGRVFGAADGQRIGYQRRATYYRDAGGNVTLQGSVQTIGTDTEVTGTADATLLIDTTAQTVTPQVTGVASTRIVWTATLETTRIADAQYEETV